MRNILYVALGLLCVVSLFSCTEFRTEVSVGDEFYEGDQLAVVGYLSNRGAVVHLQKTQSVLSNNSDCLKVENAKVELLIGDNETLAVELEPIDACNFVSPEGFMPVQNTNYCVKVSAPDMETVVSKQQTVMSGSAINSIKLEIEEWNFHVEDTTVYALFGRPRSVRCTYFIDNSDFTTLNNYSRFLFVWNNELYEFKGKDDFQRYKLPRYFFNLEMGIYNFVDIPEIIYGRKYFYDQIHTPNAVNYNGVTWQVIDRIEEIVVQSVVFSADFVNFFEHVNEYLEQRSDPFSILAEQIPSNMSNNIGYWGNVFIDEKVVALPDNRNDTIIFNW